MEAPNTNAKVGQRTQPQECHGAVGEVTLQIILLKFWFWFSYCFSLQCTCFPPLLLSFNVGVVLYAITPIIFCHSFHVGVGI